MTVHAYTSRPSDRLILHVQDIEVLGIETVAVSSPDELRALIHSSGAQAVNFYFAHMPRRAVAVEKVTDAMLRRLFR